MRPVNCSVTHLGVACAEFASPCRLIVPRSTLTYRDRSALGKLICTRFCRKINDKFEQKRSNVTTNFETRGQRPTWTNAQMARMAGQTADVSATCGSAPYFDPAVSGIDYPTGAGLFATASMGCGPRGSFSGGDIYGCEADLSEARRLQRAVVRRC